MFDMFALRIYIESKVTNKDDQIYRFRLTTSKHWSLTIASTLTPTLSLFLDKLSFLRSYLRLF